MRVHRAADKTTAVQTQQHLARDAPNGPQPHRAHAGGRGLHIINTPRLRGDIPPTLIELPRRLWRQPGAASCVARQVVIQQDLLADREIRNAHIRPFTQELVQSI